jgi:hypothetical protein
MRPPVGGGQQQLQFPTLPRMRKPIQSTSRPQLGAARAARADSRNRCGPTVARRCSQACPSGHMRAHTLVAHAHTSVCACARIPADSARGLSARARAPARAAGRGTDAPACTRPPARRPAGPALGKSAACPAWGIACAWARLGARARARARARLRSPALFVVLMRICVKLRPRRDRRLTWRCQVAWKVPLLAAPTAGVYAPARANACMRARAHAHARAPEPSRARRHRDQRDRQAPAHRAHHSPMGRRWPPTGD